MKHLAVKMRSVKKMWYAKVSRAEEVEERVEEFGGEISGLLLGMPLRWF